MKYKRAYLLILFPISFVVSLISSNSQAFSEWYCLNIYRKISIPLNQISSLFPFSIMEFVILFSLLFAIFFIFLTSRRLAKTNSNKKAIAFKLLLNTSCIACVIYFLFVFGCGINYHRYTFAKTYHYNLNRASEPELIDLCQELVVNANTLRSQIGDISTTHLEDYDKNADQATKTYNKLIKTYPTLSDKYSTPKPVFFSKVMSYLGITGVFFPYTFEANVNIDAPSYLIPATMLHELSHLQGYMREDEANFIAYLASTNSDSLYFKYSGVMLAYIYASNSLHSIDPAAYTAIKGLLAQNVKDDLTYSNTYWRQFDGTLSDISNALNDSYLKINDQQDGVKSYDRMVDLLIADYKIKHTSQ